MILSAQCCVAAALLLASGNSSLQGEPVSSAGTHPPRQLSHPDAMMIPLHQRELPGSHADAEAPSVHVGAKGVERKRRRLSRYRRAPSAAGRAPDKVQPKVCIPSHAASTVAWFQVSIVSTRTLTKTKFCICICIAAASELA
jgi:hypothetical protein